MRDLEFRAWTNEMNYLFIVSKIDFDRERVEEARGRDIDGRPLHRQHLFKDIILEQYTGIKDKNGVKIFEGDIVEGLSFENHKIKEEVYFDIYQWHPFVGHRAITDAEIIGNIHEEETK